MDALTTSASVSENLFDDVSYVIIPPCENQLELEETLDAHGAKQQQLNPKSGRIVDVSKITHVFSDNTEFPDYDNCLDHLKAVVKPFWAYASVTKNKQANPRQFTPDPSFFLNDVIVFASGIPEGDKEAIYGGVMAFGGLCAESLNKLVTHLVALSADDPVCETARLKKLGCKILLPHWFDDCLRLRRRISEAPYLLPDPEILRSNHSSLPTPRSSGPISSALSPKPEPNRLKSALNQKLIQKETNVFSGSKYFLSQDLIISQPIRKSIVEVICSGGGSVVEDINETDYLVCHYRETEDFVKFWKRYHGEQVGNLSWLYHLIVLDRWINPFTRLLHYPVPKDGVPGFENFSICISNYSGNARIYVENLLKMTGANFTKTLSQQNTHLVTAHNESQKCDAAKEWNINVVNHLWVEDSYAKMKVQSLTSSVYTHFPLRTNLGEITGQTPIDRGVIDKWLRTNYEDELRTENPNVAALQSGRQSSVTVTTPARINAEVKDVESPAVPATGSRSAKAKALSRLHDAAADIALYDKERKRAGGVTHGKDRKTTTFAIESSTKKPSPKRQIDDMHDDLEDEVSEGDELEPPGKKTKNKPTLRFRILVTSYGRWTGNENSARVQADKNKLRNLGIFVTEDPSPSGFILCAPRIVRTPKFLSALAYGPDIISTNFLDKCLQDNKLHDFKLFMLKDKAGENQNSIVLSKSLQRARLSNRKLLSNQQIFCTEQVKGGFDTYKAIIEANGGQSYLYKARVNMTLTKPLRDQDSMDIDADGDDDDEDMYNRLFLISGDTVEEKRLWPLFKKMAENAAMKPRIVKHEWMLSIALNQKIFWNDTWLWVS